MSKGDSAPPNLTLVVLAYNEEENVCPFVSDCLAYLDTLAGQHEVVVIDDGSTDGTLARARALAAGDPRVRIVSHDGNRGMGAGMRSGFATARGDYVTILAADGQVRAQELDKMLPLLAEVPIVLSVYRRRADGFHRKVLSTGLRLMMRVLLGVSFRLEGIYLFPVKVARDEIGLNAMEADTFFFSFELIGRALARGYHARTVTIDSQPRQSGETKVANWRSIQRVAGEVWRCRRRVLSEGRWRP